MTVAYEISEYYTPELLQLNPDTLYVFGDNSYRTGCGGQAIIRHEPNAFGIVTKLLPSQLPHSYFYDGAIATAMIESDIKALTLIQPHYNIAFPAQGIGTGLSDMPARCPELYAHMMQLLHNHFGVYEQFLRKSS